MTLLCPVFLGELVQFPRFVSHQYLWFLTLVPCEGLVKRFTELLVTEHVGRLDQLHEVCQLVCNVDEEIMGCLVRTDINIW